MPRLSVLWPLRLPRLGFSLGIGTTGSKVPCLSLIRVRAASGPGVVSVVNRSSPTLLPELRRGPGFDTVCLAFRPFISGSLSFTFTDLI